MLTLQLWEYGRVKIDQVGKAALGSTGVVGQERCTAEQISGMTEIQVWQSIRFLTLIKFIEFSAGQKTKPMWNEVWANLVLEDYRE